MEERVLAFIQEIFRLLGWPGVVAMMTVESAGIPLPSELVMPLSGWMLIKEGGLSRAYLFLAAFYGSLGNVLGSSLAYWLGLKGGRPLLERYGRYLLISPQELALAERWFRRYGDRAVLLSRLLPVVRTFFPFPAGIAAMNFPRFLTYTFLGSYPWCLGLAYGGYVLGENWEQLRAALRPFDLPILFLLLALVGFYFYRRLRTRPG